MNDDRFKSLQHDSRFRKKAPRSRASEKIFQLDDRFAKVLTDPEFKGARIDKRGGKRADLSQKEKLQKYFKVPEESGDDEWGDDELVSGAYDPARGIGVDDDSSSEQESSEDENQVDELLHNWNFNDDNVMKSEEATSSVLAMCNFDAEEITAQDIFMLLSSFLPLNAGIKSVKIYISDFGQEKLDIEAVEGPKELKVESDHESEDEADAESRAQEKVRLYQAQRLKYYYAIIDCSDSDTAAQLYEACDGLEFESSATFVDLRFVPEKETFDDKPLKDEFIGNANLTKYKPILFQNKSLSHQKADLTWDAGDRRRKEILNKNSANLKDEDLDEYAAFVASSSSEEGSELDEAQVAEKRKQLLGDTRNGFKESTKKNAGLDVNKSVTIQLSSDEVKMCKLQRAKTVSSESEQEDIVSESEEKNSEVKESSNNLELLLADVEDEDHTHFDYNKIVKAEKMSEKSRKRKSIKEADDFHIDHNDLRFRALFERPEFAIDPSDPKFRATNAMKEVVAKRAQIRSELVENPNCDSEPKSNSTFKNVSDESSNSKRKLQSLVQSLKSKSAHMKMNSKNRLK